MLRRSAIALCSIVPAAIWPLSVSSAAETPVPRTVSGDVGRVYLLNAERHGSIVTALHKRIHDGDTVYSRTEFDCQWRMMRSLGYSRRSPDDIRLDKGQWIFLESGSARSDLAAFVCR